MILGLDLRQFLHPMDGLLKLEWTKKLNGVVQYQLMLSFHFYAALIKYRTERLSIH